MIEDLLKFENLEREQGSNFMMRFLQLLRHNLPDESEETLDAILYQKAFPPAHVVDQSMWEMEQITSCFDENELKRITTLKKQDVSGGGFPKSFAKDVTGYIRKRRQQ